MARRPAKRPFCRDRGNREYTHRSQLEDFPHFPEEEAEAQPNPFSLWKSGWEGQRPQAKPHFLLPELHLARLGPCTASRSGTLGPHMSIRTQDFPLSPDLPPTKECWLPCLAWPPSGCFLPTCWHRWGASSAPGSCQSVRPPLSHPDGEPEAQGGQVTCTL